MFNIHKMNLKKNLYKFVGFVLTTYVGVRHILPTENKILIQQAYGDKIVLYQSTNFILFDQVTTWYDGYMCQSYTSYHWRRIHLTLIDENVLSHNLHL